MTTIVNGTVTNDCISTALVASQTTNIACQQQQQQNDTSDEEYDGTLDPNETIFEAKHSKQNPLDSWVSFSWI